MKIKMIKGTVGRAALTKKMIEMLWMDKDTVKKGKKTDNNVSSNTTKSGSHSFNASELDTFIAP